MPRVYELKLLFEKLHEECNFPIEVLLPGQDIDEVMRKDLAKLNSKRQRLAQAA